MERSAKTLARAVRPAEHLEQSWLFQWAEIAAPRYPELRDLYAIPNFSGRIGKVPPRAAVRQALQLNAEGRRRGVPDMHLPHARGGFHSLYVEMKRQRATPSETAPEQRDWHARLRAAGHCVVVANGWEDAREAILAYLAKPAFTPQPEPHRA